MARFQSRRMTWLALPAMLLLLQACSIRKTVHTELVIPATPEEVWAVLTDVGGYEAWNAVLVSAEGEFREGSQLRYQMKVPDGEQSEIVSTVVKMIPHRELNQTGGIPWILTFDHRYLLASADGGTRVTQHEEYHGLWVPFWDANWVEPAYAKVNEALRDRVLALRRKR